MGHHSLNQSQDPEDPIEIAGTTLEGGGQLVRLTIGLAALTGRSIRIKNVRGGRGGGGGLKNQHLVSVNYLGEASSAWTEGAFLQSKELFFVPHSVDSNHAHMRYEHPTKLSDGTFARRVTIGMDSNGAVSLVLQATLPYLLLATSTSNPPRTRPIVLTLKGGTHVSSSPTTCYVEHVFIHNLSKIFPASPPLISPSRQHRSKRGWTSGRQTPGEVSYLIHPVDTGGKLPAFSISRRGPLRKIVITLLAPDEGRHFLRDDVLKLIKKKFPEVPEVKFIEDEESGSNQRYYLLLIAETAEGFRLGRDLIFSGSVGSGKRGSTRREEVVRLMAEKCVERLGNELQSGLALDHCMVDQLAVFAGLADGRSTLCGVDDGEPGEDDVFGDPRTSMHAITARWALERVVGADFEEDGSCTGIGFVAGEQLWESRGPGESEIKAKYKKYQDAVDEGRRKLEEEAENVEEHLRDLHLQGKMPQW